MKNKLVIIILVFGLAGYAIAVSAAENAETILHGFVIGAGGSQGGSGNLTLDYTLGQPVVGEREVGSSEFCSGYWCDPMWRIYLPITARNL